MNHITFVTAHFNCKLLNKYNNNASHQNAGNKYNEKFSNQKSGAINHNRENITIHTSTRYSRRFITILKISSIEESFIVCAKSRHNNFKKTAIGHKKL